MVDVNVTRFEIEVNTGHGDLVRADVYLLKGRDDPFPVLLGASPHQKALRNLPPVPTVFPFIEYGPIQLYLDEGYAYVAMDVPGMGRSEGTWDPVSRAEGEAIHDMIEHVATQSWAGPIGMIGMSYYCWSQWNAARTRPPRLVTIAALDGATDMYRDWMYQGGIPIQGFLNSWLYGSVLLEHMAEGRSITDHGRVQILSQMYEHSERGQERPRGVAQRWLPRNRAARRRRWATSWTYPDPKWMAGVTTMDKQGVPHHTARVVTFTTEPFEQDCELTGQGVLHLFASSDQTDTDVMVKVSLLPGDPLKPPSIRGTQGWLRASHRAEDPELTTEMRPFLKHDRAEPIEPGQEYELRIELIPMSVLVSKGERLRLEISNWESAITEAPMTH